MGLRSAPAGVSADVEHASGLDLVERLLNMRYERENGLRCGPGNEQHDDAE
jgi:hypothetical protein